MNKLFVKVTPSGSEKSYVIPEANKMYYLSQGAVVAPASDEEIREAYPNEFCCEAEVTLQPKADSDSVQGNSAPEPRKRTYTRKKKTNS